MGWGDGAGTGFSSDFDDAIAENDLNEAQNDTDTVSESDFADAEQQTEDNIAANDALDDAFAEADAQVETNIATNDSVSQYSANGAKEDATDSATSGNVSESDFNDAISESDQVESGLTQEEINEAQNALSGSQTATDDPEQTPTVEINQDGSTTITDPITGDSITYDSSGNLQSSDIDGVQVSIDGDQELDGTTTVVDSADTWYGSTVDVYTSTATGLIKDTVTNVGDTQVTTDTHYTESGYKLGVTAELYVDTIELITGETIMQSDIADGIELVTDIIQVAGLLLTGAQIIAGVANLPSMTKALLDGKLDIDMYVTAVTGMWNAAGIVVDGLNYIGEKYDDGTYSETDYQEFLNDLMGTDGDGDSANSDISGLGQMRSIDRARSLGYIYGAGGIPSYDPYVDPTRNMAGGQNYMIKAAGNSLYQAHMAKDMYAKGRNFANKKIKNSVDPKFNLLFDNKAEERYARDISNKKTRGAISKLRVLRVEYNKESEVYNGLADDYTEMRTSLDSKIELYNSTYAGQSLTSESTLAKLEIDTASQTLSDFSGSEVTNSVDRLGLLMKELEETNATI